MGMCEQAKRLVLPPLLQIVCTRAGISKTRRWLLLHVTSDNLWYYYYSVCQTNFEEINRIKYIDAMGREVIKRTGTTRLLLWTVQCWRLSVCYFFQRPSHPHHHSHKLKFKAQLSTIWPNKIYYCAIIMLMMSLL